MRRLLLTAAFTLALALPGPQPSAAQALATLVADRVALAGNDTLVADGTVEILYEGRRLKASRILYDRASDSLTIDGPIVLTEASGQTVILASQAELSADLTEGVLQSARVVLNQQLQLAADEVMRIGGRYTVLSNTVASSCKICASSPTPLWEIRARRIVHDTQERQIYFDRAQLRFYDTPIFYLPRLRIPDPTLTRATGFLRPSIRTTSDLGTGIKVPYFIRIGDSSDLTVTPYISTKNAKTVELRYRQAFKTGRIEFNGAYSRDQILPGDARGYAQLTGGFDLPRDFLLSFDGIVVSDRAYLVDYGISDEDRLESRIELTRTRRNEFISSRLIGFKSIREGDVNSTLPSIVSDLTWQRRFSPQLIGGEAGLRFQTHSHYRSSDVSLDSDGDGISDGRDTGRISLVADWRRNWVLDNGMLFSALGEAKADFYQIRQDASVAGRTTRLYGGAGVELRWPWTRSDANGVGHVIEPVVQLLWSPNNPTAVPNEDSVLVEFDESNLYSLSRFPGADAVERGARVNVGIGYTRHDPSGWSLGFTLGRVIRAQDYNQFGTASGLDGQNSDWLAAMRLDVQNGLAMTNRLVFDDKLQITKAELRMDLARPKYEFSGSYIWVLPDETESRTDQISELNVDATYKFTPAWEGTFTTRYDFEADRAASAGLNLAFRNECLKFDVSVSRRFTSSTAVNPTTSFGLSVDLLGFGGKAAAGPARSCRG